ncbi:LysR substrate-binding domain-containing protein [Nocardia nova]|uniref:LysR substrate-binding domain-containing protein n=1 Tax=Nocardia nova TaxID=37330 RepID=UPI0037936E8C
MGVALFERTPKGVVPTAAGSVLHEEACALLRRADRIRERVTTAAGTATLTIGTLADTAAHVDSRLVAAFRARHPYVQVRIHETDLGDPTAGLRAGLVDVALTRTPFDANGIGMRVLRSIRVGVVMRENDPLAHRSSGTAADLTDRRWVRLPAEADRAWTAYWTCGTVEIDFHASWQESRGPDYLPTGERIDPLPGPWDDCFGMPDGVDVTLTWPGALELKVTSAAEWVVIYDQQPGAVCVEPQSGPPNGLNTLPRLVTPAAPLDISMTSSWRPLT